MAQQKGMKRAEKVARRKRKVDRQARQSNLKKLAKHEHEHTHEHEHAHGKSEK